MKTLEIIIQMLEEKVLQQEKEVSDTLNDNTLEVQYMISLIELGI